MAIAILVVTVRAQPLDGTQPLTLDGDLASRMVDGMHRFLDKETAGSVERRAGRWKRDFASPEAYEKSVAPNREHLARMLGVVDARVAFDSPELIATVDQPALVGKGDGFEVFAVRWPALQGVDAEGVLLVPVGREPIADVVALPDADQTPEAIAGLTKDLPPQEQYARRLAASGCRVLVPMLISRDDEFSVMRNGKGTNQPHREFVYRPAFEVGRTVIGDEVQKVLAVVDWFERKAVKKPAKIGVIGYGEGGLIAFYAAALDTRITSTCVSGYFGPREGLWHEPIYRNVCGLLREFGDAEIASLIAPRALVVETCRTPQVKGPPAPRAGRPAGAAPGEIHDVSPQDAASELKRSADFTAKLSPPPALQQIVSGDAGDGPFCSDAALRAFASTLGVQIDPKDASVTPLGPSFDPKPRLKRQIDQLSDFTQRLVRESPEVRKKYWAEVDRGSPEAFARTIEPMRQRFYDDLIGRIDYTMLPPNARTRRIYDQPKHVGYEVVLDVFDDVIAYGILLVPKDLKPGERRPVVVCQHGLEGRPQDVADGRVDNHYYHAFAARLADQGFVTYAPQNLYIFQDRFRSLQRKLNPLGLTLYSLIVPQHQQTVDWLGSLPFVDKDRIAFYGLSYGGKTAMRVPPLVKGYCLSICSGDFNEWVWKNTSLDYAASYVGMNEYEIFEWNLANTFNYAEMAELIAPRPFMVERGHRDGVGIDEWVSYEYAKVRLLYADLKIPEKTTIEYFDGPHTIHGVGTFEFLHEQLRYPTSRER